jgi:hypothetical protein
MDFSSRPTPSALARRIHVPPIEASVSSASEANSGQMSGRLPVTSPLYSGFHGSSGMLQGYSAAGPPSRPSTRLGGGAASQSDGGIGRSQDNFDFLEDAVKSNFLFACLTPDQRR